MVNGTYLEGLTRNPSVERKFEEVREIEKICIHRIEEWGVLSCLEKKNKDRS